jgi:hypothetical protein
MRAIMMAGLLAYGVTASAGPVCHIHPPAADDAAASPPIVGPYESAEACEKANALLYSGQGRCHCAFDAGSAGNKPSLPKLPGNPEDPAFGFPMPR